MLKRLVFVFIAFVAVVAGIGIFFLPKTIPVVSTPAVSTPAVVSEVLPPESPKKTICLNMIVKDESAVIQQCLASVKGLIDHWVIVDTGSKDGTQDIIKEFMKDIPGTLYERPWVDFSHNRNEALMLAKNKADYSLFIDADEVLLFAKDFAGLKPDKDVYFINVQQKDSSNYLRWFLVNNKLTWNWRGILHELLECKEPSATQTVISNVVNFSDTSKGARSKNPKKYLDDAKVLLKGLEQEPNNTRYQFYLAQSYANAGELCLALDAYQKRASAPVNAGYSEEVFMSLYLTARIQDILNMPTNIVLRSYKKAHEHTPTRLEPLFYAGTHHMKTKDYEKAYALLKKVCSLTPSPMDNLFVELDIYAWKANSCLAELCWNLRKPDETLEACEKVANSPNAPEKTREEMKNNIASLKALIANAPKN